MGVRLRAFDWSATPLGPIEDWSITLRVTVDQMLSSKFPSCLFWGQDLIAIYNDGYRIILGSKPEALGEPMRVTWKEAFEEIRPFAEKALAGEATFIEDFKMPVERNGRIDDAYFTFNYGPVFDEHGQVLGLLDTVVETTSKVMSEHLSRQEREQQQSLLQKMPGFVAVMSGPEHVFIYTNEAYIKIAGARQLLGLSVRKAFPELEGQGFFEMLDQVYASGEALKLNTVPVQFAGDRDNRYIELIYEPIRNQNNEVHGIFVGGYDVTDRVKAEEGLRALNIELERKVIERTQARGLTWQVSPDLLGALNPQGYFATSNPAWKTVLGWTEEEVAGMSIFELLHPDDVERTRVGFSLTQIGQPAIRFPNRYRCKDGSYRWISWVGIPEDGMVYCSGRDITVEKQAEQELASAQDALRQSQKMEAVGQLTGGIAHDFNNLLGSVSGSLQLMRSRIAKGKLEGIERYIGMSEDSVRRASTLTQRLLAFSRRQTLDPKPVDVNRLVGGMEELIRRTVGPAIELEVIGAGGLWPTRVDAPQLENSLLNLCINARDAMPDGGKLTIETANKWLDERAAKERNLAPGQYISLCVTDSGIGMSADLISRIFDPFFTTKPLGQGTGLGLSMVYGFVRQSGGQVRVYSEPGQGTTMCLYLPRHLGEAELEEAMPAADLLESGDGETVLVIEDEWTIREVIMEVLEECGYKVLTADNGPAGLRILQGDARIDLLVTDVGLPGGMNGRQIADAARVVRPALKVLFITGYADNAAVGNGHLERGMEVLTKPFEIVALAKKVQEMIDSTSL